MIYKNYKSTLSLILLFHISFYWLLIQPAGHFFIDEYYLYKQALTKIYVSWHPLLLSFSSRFFFDLGFNLAGITLIQCGLSFIGLLVLIKKINYSLYPGSEISNITILIVYILLISPLSPFPYKTMHYGTDTWLTIFLIFLIIIFIDFKNNFKRKYKNYNYFFLFILGIIAALICNIRNNSIFLLPFIVLLFNALSKLFTKNKLFKILIIILPIITTLSLNLFLNKYLEVQKIHTKNVVMVADNVSLISSYPDLAKELPYTFKILKKDYRQKIGSQTNINKLSWSYFYLKPYLILTEDSLCFKPIKKLRDEYYNIIIKHPFKLLYLKFNRWLGHFNIDVRYKVVINSPFLKSVKLDQNSYFKSLRKVISKIDHFIIDRSIMIRVLFRTHLPWFILNIIIIFFIYSSNYLNEIKKEHILILLLPLAYYLSFVVATPSYRFRYMYPSNLLIQIYFYSIFMNTILTKFYNIYKINNKKIKY